MLQNWMILLPKPLGLNLNVMHSIPEVCFWTRYPLGTIYVENKHLNPLFQAIRSHLSVRRSLEMIYHLLIRKRMNPVNYLMMLLGKNEDRTKILAAIHLAHNSTLPLTIDRHRVLLHLIGAKRNLRIIKAIISRETTTMAVSRLARAPNSFPYQYCRQTTTIQAKMEIGRASC